MLLGIDLGTGSVKALLLATDVTVLAEAASSYPVHAPHPGWAESDPADWWSAVAIAVKTAVKDRADQIQAIGLSGQMHGVVLADGEGTPLRSAILWADTRSTSVLSSKRCCQTIGGCDECYQHGGKRKCQWDYSSKSQHPTAQPSSAKT